MMLDESNQSVNFDLRWACARGGRHKKMRGERTARQPQRYVLRISPAHLTNQTQ